MPFHPEVRQKQIDEARKRNAREAKQHRQKQKQIAQKKIDEARHVAAAKEASAAHEVDKANVEIHKNSPAKKKHLIVPFQRTNSPTF